MQEIERLSAFDTEVTGLERSLGAATGMSAAFTTELRGFRDALGGTTQDLGRLERGLTGGLRRAFDGLVFDGDRLSDALAGVGRSVMRSAYNAAVQPVIGGIGGMLTEGLSGILGGLLPFAQGGSFAQGRVMPFAKGGVISSATAFPLRGGQTGLMGEAGPEAIMPLARGADGRLGVRGGGGAVHVTMNVTTPDVTGFQRSQSQIAAGLGRALARGQRNT